MRSGSVPARWTEFRVVFLAKASGGFRPLSIASVIWRIGAGVIDKKLGSWSCDWAMGELAGGLTQRSAALCHARLQHDIKKAEVQF